MESHVPVNDRQKSFRCAPGAVGTETAARFRVGKETALVLARQLAPLVMELFRSLRFEDGWAVFSRKVLDLRTRLKLDEYVRLYEHESHIALAMFKAIDLDGELAQQCMDAEALPLVDRLQFVDECARALLETDWSWLDDAITDDPVRRGNLVAKFEALSKEAQERATRMSRLFFMAWIAYAFDLISVMVHGARLTTLVPKAVAGDEEAFLKAVHIDKNLLFLHPWFFARYQVAQAGSEKAFLDRVSYRLRSSPIRGRIRHHELFALFALLDSLRWLRDLRHAELLGLCDEIGLDRWGNRIEDVTAVTKRLREYRRYQESNAVSMH